MRLLVIAPHPDDEVLGVGGTIARYSSEGHEVYVVIVTKGEPEIFDPELISVGRQEALKAHASLGVSKTIFLDFPAARLDTVEHRLLNATIGETIASLQPEMVFLPFAGDVHKDHRLVFESALVALRPVAAGFVREILCYETLSETNWNAPFSQPSFIPDVYVDISSHLASKLSALRLYASQMKAFPNERSIEAAEAMAKSRGATIGRNAAEALSLIHI